MFAPEQFSLLLLQLCMISQRGQQKSPHYFKLSDFMQSCLQGIQALETRTIFILTDTISPTSCLLFGL